MGLSVTHDRKEDGQDEYAVKQNKYDCIHRAPWYWPCKNFSKATISMVMWLKCKSILSHSHSPMLSLYCFELYLVQVMSYIHKHWVIDGWTDWLVHAFGTGVSGHSFAVQNNLTKLIIEPPRHLGSFPSGLQRDGELVNDMTLLCILWRVSGAVIFPSSYPYSLPFHADRSPRWETWSNQEVLIGVPFACLIRPFHSRQLRYFIYIYLLSNSPTLIAIPHQSSSLSPFAITITGNSLQCSLLSVFHSTLDSFYPITVRSSTSRCLAILKDHWAKLTHATKQRASFTPSVNAFIVTKKFQVLQETCLT